MKSQSTELSNELVNKTRSENVDEKIRSEENRYLKYQLHKTIL